MGAPYPAFLALGGALLAFLPGPPLFAVPPDLALALLVAPILLDAAYNASLRDLRDNWAPVTGLVIFAVGLTTAAVAVVAHSLDEAERGPYFAVAGAVLITVIVVRIAWHMAFNAVLRWRHHRHASTRYGRCCGRPSAAVWSYPGPACGASCPLRPRWRSRPAFPYRDLIVLAAFSVVLGTLVIQGLTLKPLPRALNLHDEDPIGREVNAAREAR